jgi:very-short-patch-repair endonuclease
MSYAEALAGIAQPQYGVFTVAQAASKHCGRTAIARLAAKGTVQRLLPGVYALEGADSFESKLFAAWLWAGEDAVVSHGAAAALWRLDGFDKVPPPPEITVPREHSIRTPPSVLVHRGDVPAEDRKAIRRIPLTTVARTLVDLAGSADEEALAIALEDAWRRKLAQLDWIERRMREAGGRGKPGMRALRSALKDCRKRERPLESALEVRVWRLLKKHDLPLPKTALDFRDDEGHPLRLDFAYVEQRVAIEADGFETHGPREAFEKDRTRLSRVAADGWKVVHLTDRHLRDEPERAARWVARALGWVPRADD